MKVILLLFTLNFLMLIRIISQKLISIGATLLARAITVTLLTSFTSNSWFAFILFLIYITGLLVLFGYFLAIRPNLHQTAKKCFKTYIALFIPIMFIPINLINLPTFKIRFEKDVISLISNNNILIYWLITIILLITLLIVVSLTYKSPSPLRNYLN